MFVWLKFNIFNVFNRFVNFTGNKCNIFNKEKYNLPIMLCKRLIFQISQEKSQNEHVQYNLWLLTQTIVLSCFLTVLNLMYSLKKIISWILHHSSENLSTAILLFFWSMCLAVWKHGWHEKQVDWTLRSTTV